MVKQANSDFKFELKKKLFLGQKWNICLVWLVTKFILRDTFCHTPLTFKYSILFLDFRFFCTYRFPSVFAGVTFLRNKKSQYQAQSVFFPFYLRFYLFCGLWMKRIRFWALCTDNFGCVCVCDSVFVRINKNKMAKNIKVLYF